MSGHVFHPGHAELHGVTVVVESQSGTTWVGRYHELTDRGVFMHDVAIHDPATASITRDAWLTHLIKFGINVDAKHLVIPTAEAGKITRLLEFETRTG